jgi:hypothetical protein
MTAINLAGPMFRLFPRMGTAGLYGPVLGLLARCVGG